MAEPESNDDQAVTELIRWGLASYLDHPDDARAKEFVRKVQWLCRFVTDDLFAHMCYALGLTNPDLWLHSHNQPEPCEIGIEIGVKAFGPFHVFVELARDRAPVVRARLRLHPVSYFHHDAVREALRRGGASADADDADVFFYSLDVTPEKADRLEDRVREVFWEWIFLWHRVGGYFGMRKLVDE